MPEKHLIKTICLILILLSADYICASGVRRQETDAESIRNTLERFYASYRSTDKEEWKKLWHDNSPIFYQREKTFAGWKINQTSPPSLVSLTIETGWSKTFATVELTFSENSLKRTAGLVKEGSAWKIWHESSKTTSDLAARLDDETILKADQSLLNDSELISALSWLGYKLYEKKQFEDSTRKFELAVRLGELGEDKQALASALIQIGHNYLELGKYKSAKEAYQQALQLSQRVNFDIGSIRALGGIGNAANFLGQYFEARDAQEKRLELLRKTNNTRRISITLKNLGNSYFYLGEFEKALKAYEECERLGFEDTGLILNLGAVLTELEKLPDAEKKLQNGLQLARGANNSIDVAYALNGLGEVALKRGQFRAAHSFFQQALKESGELKADERAKILLNDGYANLKAGDYRAAASLTEQAIKLAAETESPDPVWFGNYVLGKTLKAQNLNKQAFEAFERSVSSIENWLSQSNNPVGLEIFFQDKVEPYRELINLLVDDNQNARALEYAELSKAKTLFKAIRGVNQSIEPAPFTLSQAGELLKDEQTALLEFVVTEDATILFLITKSSGAPQLTVKKLPLGREVLGKYVTSLRNRLSEENYDFSDLSKKLYDVLLKPIEEKIADKQKLVIVPDRVIWGLPFQALKMSSESFLWERFSLTYARSLASLRAGMRQADRFSDNKPTFLGVANPLTPPADALPFAEESVRKIVPFYGAPLTRIFTGGAATETEVKASLPDYDIVHFATHGYLDEQSPMSSYLQLTANDFSDNGKLEANEIQNLKIKADLVILAGCETGGGKIIDGEGIIGLGWALEKAGAQTLVVSHWKVRDKNTKDLMIEFHRLWRTRSGSNSTMTVAQALRLAALTIQKRHPHPVYWAGFMVMGNGF